MTTPFNEIPRIDLSPLHDQSIEGIKEVAQYVREVYTTVGFGYLINHGVDQSLIDNAFEAAKIFHDLPMEEKNKIKQNKFFRGFMSNKESIIKQSTLGVATKPNYSEAFIVAHEVPEADSDYQAEINLVGPNQWPENLPGFREVVTSYNQAMYALAKKMVQVFSVAFGLGVNDLDKYFMRPTTFLRLQYYPEQPAIIPEDQFGIAPHTDYGFLTLLAQDDVGGLQVKNQLGEWIDAPPVPGSFMLNSSDMLSRMTNNQFLSTPHRVINTSGRKRFSIPFFFEPDMHAIIDTLPGFTDDNENAAQPIQYAEHLLGRIRANYSLGV